MNPLKSLFKSTPEKKLWEQSSEFDPVWKQRISRMVSYMDIPGVVADFGCGMMWLEGFLPKQNSYLPIDYIKRDERTIVLDLNKGSWEKVHGDIAFLSGVLEYVEDISGFADKLEAAGFKKVILSYCTLEKHPDLNVRKNLNWVSNASLFDLLAAFTRRYQLMAIDDVNTNTILVFDRKVR